MHSYLFVANAQTPTLALHPDVYGITINACRDAHIRLTPTGDEYFPNRALKLRNRDARRLAIILNRISTNYLGRHPQIAQQLVAFAAILRTSRGGELHAR